VEIKAKPKGFTYIILAKTNYEDIRRRAQHITHEQSKDKA
jgi:hypothetical protein